MSSLHGNFFHHSIKNQIFLISKQLHVAMHLHSAFDSEDPEAAERALADPFIRHMDVEYAKLARSIPMPKGLGALENASKHNKTNLESLNLDDLRAIDDDVRITQLNLKSNFSKQLK